MKTNILKYLIFLQICNTLHGAAFIDTENAMKFSNRLKHQIEDEITFKKEHVRTKRYLGLGRKFKLNRRYQECIAPGDVKGHCKHILYCPADIFSGNASLEFLCVIEKAHVGVCCPDDIASSTLVGSRLLFDLPAGGNDYDENITGCGMPARGSSAEATKETQIWPWIVALYRPQEGAIDQQFCGGSLITDSHVLTASHCFNQQIPAKDIRARLGEYDFSRRSESRSQDYEVEEIIKHENFVLSTYENDIAIVRLKKSTSFNSYIWPICLPGYGESYNDQTVVVAGWGQIYANGPESDVLMQVEIPIWIHENCSDSFVQKITDDMMCAAGYEGGKDSCYGDSGGPLMQQLPNGRWVAIGVVSWGIGCGVKGKPGVYTKVGNYLPWIIKHTMTKH